MPTFYLAGTVNFRQTTLNGSINSTQTTITLNSTANLSSPGYIVIDRQDSAGNNTPTAREIVTYTGISGNDLTGVTRAADGSSGLAHNDGALVEVMPTVGMWNSLTTIVSTALTSDSLLKAIVSPVTIASMYLSSTASIAAAMVGTRLDASGASITGIPRTFVWYAAGFASAATTNVMRLITPFAGTFQAFSMTTRTPVSAASLSVAIYNIRSGASIFDTVGRPNILGGGTFASTASIKTPNFISGDVLRMDIENGGSVADITLEGIAY